MMKQSEDKRFGVRIDKDEIINKVWVCLSCYRYKIQVNKPNDCICHNPMFVIDLNKRAN